MTKPNYPDEANFSISDVKRLEHLYNYKQEPYCVHITLFLYEKDVDKSVDFCNDLRHKLDSTEKVFSPEQVETFACKYLTQKSKEFEQKHSWLDFTVSVNKGNVPNSKGFKR